MKPPCFQNLTYRRGASLLFILIFILIFRGWQASTAHTEMWFILRVPCSAMFYNNLPAQYLPVSVQRFITETWLLPDLGVLFVVNVSVEMWCQITRKPHRFAKSPHQALEQPLTAREAKHVAMHAQNRIGYALQAIHPIRVHTRSHYILHPIYGLEYMYIVHVAEMLYFRIVWSCWVDSRRMKRPKSVIKSNLWHTSPTKSTRIMPRIGGSWSVLP